MKSIALCAAAAAVMLFLQAALAATPGEGLPGLSPGPETLLAQRARTCKQVRSCREAVEIWCDGYSRADADHDGIPCENICHSKDEVDEIREEIGC